MKLWASNRGIKIRREVKKKGKPELIVNCLKVRHVPFLTLNAVNTVVKR